MSAKESSPHNRDKGDGFVDYYALLGISVYSSGRAIRRAWLRKIRKFHPDFHVGESDLSKYVRLAAQINEAYDILADSDARQKYDAVWKEHHVEQEKTRADEKLFPTRKSDGGADKIRSVFNRGEVSKVAGTPSPEKKPAGTKKIKKVSSQKTAGTAKEVLSKKNVNFLRFFVFAAVGISLLFLCGVSAFKLIGGNGSPLAGEEKNDLTGAGETVAGAPDVFSELNLLEIPGLDYCHMGQYEVTRDFWSKIVGEALEDAEAAMLPMTNVSWYEADEFCKKLTDWARERSLIGEDLEFRLPTPYEWFCAARAGTGNCYAGCDDELLLMDYDWSGGNAAGTAHRVGQKKPNEWGFFDMSGNVREWCVSGKHESMAFVRGGGFLTCDDHKICEALFEEKNWKSPDTGFRVVLVKKDLERDFAKTQVVPELVKIREGFWAGTCEITRHQWDAFEGTTKETGFVDTVPVGGVSWYEAKRYCEKLTAYAREHGLISEEYFFRLPTNEEFTELCRHREDENENEPWDKNSFCGWSRENCHGSPHPVGELAPNAYGIFDMHGNMLEWTEDKTYRGSSIHHSNNTDCHCGEKSWTHPDRKNWSDLGFRIVLVSKNAVPAVEGKESVPAVEGKESVPVEKSVPPAVPVEPILTKEEEARRKVREEAVAYVGILQEIKDGFVEIPRKDYQASRYELTQRAYRLMMGKNPSYPVKGYTEEEMEMLPVTNVSWSEACRFCEKLTRLSRAAGLIGEDWEFRLPTTDEWEYICRAGTQTWFCNGNTGRDLDRVAWWSGNSRAHPHTCGLKAPNKWGLYDMHGNVWEWCQDLKKSKSEVPACGGSCREPMGYCRSNSVKHYKSADISKADVGFRLVLAPAPVGD
ncbi:MAG: SUMF1/EgtB/PvdO family nonheme iron enzyme [Opitutales bacterium]|nr:SUMF1/EgtB/PvdO family nonheme iron enzyme [Opitutales bacterium]